MDVIGDRGVASMDAFNQNLELVEDRSERVTLVPWAAGGDPGLIRSFVDAIRDDTEPVISGDDGLHAMAVALCAYESAKRREPVVCPDCLLD